MSDFTTAESAAIEAAVQSGKVTRIENGEWPDVGRYEMVRLKSPAVRKKQKRERIIART